MSETISQRSSWPRVSAPSPEQIAKEKADATRLDAVRQTLLQYTEGAITYIEFAAFVAAKVTKEDVDEHNSFLPPEQHLRFGF